jgi:AP-3 complex subunit mu
MPDLSLSFVNPRLFDDVSFHPCVRFKRWEVRTAELFNPQSTSATAILLFFQSERLLSFIPPDGNFRLMSYHVGSQSIVAIPVYVRHSLSLRETGSGGRLDITLGPKQTLGRTVNVLSINQFFIIYIICFPTINKRLRMSSWRFQCQKACLTAVL